MPWSLKDESSSSVCGSEPQQPISEHRHSQLNFKR